MFRRTRVELLSVAILPLGIALALSEAPSPVAAAQDGPISFARQVLPIFQSTCAECHGTETKEVELGLTTYEDVMKGSEYGTVVEAGDPDASLLVEMISAGEMPQDAPALEADQIALIRTWIQQGAQNN